MSELAQGRNKPFVERCTLRLLTSCLEGTASKPPKQDNCATKRHAPFSFSLEPKQVGKPKMSITDMTGHMECMVVSECLWDDCILSTFLCHPFITLPCSSLVTKSLVFAVESLFIINSLGRIQSCVSFCRHKSRKCTHTGALRQD